MKITKIKKALVLVTIAAGALAVGCELIVDFDRTRIPVDVPPEASIGDATADAPSTTGEGGADAADAQDDAADSAAAPDGDAGGGGGGDADADALLPL